MLKMSPGNAHPKTKMHTPGTAISPLETSPATTPRRDSPQRTLLPPPQLSPPEPRARRDCAATDKCQGWGVAQRGHCCVPIVKLRILLVHRPPQGDYACPARVLWAVSNTPLARWLAVSYAGQQGAQQVLHIRCAMQYTHYLRPRPSRGSAGLSPSTVGRGAVNTSTTRSCSPDTELVWACTNEGPTPRPEKSPSNKASVTPVSVSTHKLGVPSFMIGATASSTPEAQAPVSPGPVSVCDTPAPAPAPAAPAVTPPPSPDSAATQGMAAVARHRVPDNARVGMESGATGTEKVVPLHAPPYGDSTDRHRANRAPPLCMHGVAKSRVRSTTKRVAGIGSRMLPPMRRSFPADSSSARISATLVPTRVAVRPAANVCPATCRNQPVNNNASATVDRAQRQNLDNRLP